MDGNQQQEFITALGDILKGILERLEGLETATPEFISSPIEVAAPNVNVEGPTVPVEVNTPDIDLTKITEAISGLNVNNLVEAVGRVELPKADFQPLIEAIQAIDFAPHAKEVDDSITRNSNETRDEISALTSAITDLAQATKASQQQTADKLDALQAGQEENSAQIKDLADIAAADKQLILGKDGKPEGLRVIRK